MTDNRIYFESTALDTTGCVCFDANKFVLASKPSIVRYLQEHDYAQGLCNIMGMFGDDLATRQGRKENEGNFYLMHTRLEDRLVHIRATIASKSSNDQDVRKNYTQIEALESDMYILKCMSEDYNQDPCLIEHLGIGKDGRCISYFQLMDDFEITKDMYHNISRAGRNMPEAMMYLCKQSKLAANLPDDYFKGPRFTGLFSEMWNMKMFDPVKRLPIRRSAC